MKAISNRRLLSRAVLVGVICAAGLGPEAPEAYAQRRPDKRSGSQKPAPATTTTAPASPAPTATPAAKGDTGGSGDAGRSGKPRVFDFTGLDIGGRLRTPQLLYFLERANEELERASLERRSFIPEMVRTLDEAPL